MERTLYYNLTDRGIEGGWKDKWYADFMQQYDKEVTYFGQVKITASKEGCKIEHIEHEEIKKAT